ncbi:ribose-phosphate diphosphokinase [Halofilum ochraceum]|uniref:ribose-phosphate diphosphokinase n=1 Tax=Halofilum ochraceum TaxID=1611323 RepID=UPI0008322D68|nr:ribose-phosphate diphosphokinase [Halofilum ochraceum]
MMVFAGNANPDLAQSVCEHLNLPLGKANVGSFSDGETTVEVLENVRGKDAFIVQSTCQPTNDNMMEILLLCDALRRASVERITAVVPYFGYSRQDRRIRHQRVPVSAKVVANILCTAGIDRLLTVDLHADQIQGFFDIPVDNVYASPLLLGDIWRQKHPNIVVVSPDVGGVVRARAVAKRLDDSDLAIIDKRRPRANESEVMHIIGDVRDRTCIIIDDLVDTAGTLCQAAKALKEHGARAVVAYATHPVLSGPAVERIDNSTIDELVVTDTIPLSEAAAASPRIRQLGVAELLAETLRRVHREESVSSLYVD